LVTLIFAMEIGPFWNSAFRDGWNATWMECNMQRLHPRYSTANALAKAKALCSFSPSFSSEPRF
jgi:hypothetical protein